MTPRQRVVKYLVQITQHTTVEDQLRRQWLQELSQIKTLAKGRDKPKTQKKRTKSLAKSG